MNPRLSSNAIRNEKVFRSISFTLVFLMMVCVVMTIGILIQNTLPDWHSGIIAGLLLFIVIDRLFTYQHLKSLTPLSSEWAIALGSQWIVILVFIRLLLSYAKGLDSFRTDLSLFARGYIENVFTPEFLITLLLAFLVWVLTAQFLELLDEIGLDQKLALHEDSGYVESGVVPAHQRLVKLIFSMGIILVILTTLTRIDLHTNVSNPGGIPRVDLNRFSGGEAGALLYFVFGLALLSLSRLMSLQTHWNRQRIPVSSNNLVRQWGIYSLFFLVILAVIVSLLPAGDSLGFFSLLGTMLGFLLGVLFFIGQLIVALILLLISLPFLLFGKASPFISRPAPPSLPALVEPALPTTSAVWALIRSILLWGSLLVILIYSFIYFVRQHEDILAALRKSRITNWLVLAWQWLYRNADKTRGTLSRVIADGWQSIVSRLEGKRILPRVDFISLGSLDPRRRIFFFYLALIRRGGEQGLRREPSQTPSEYAVILEKSLPSASEDIDSITEAFVQARYSRQEIDSRKADLIKATWGRIRRALQSKSKSEQSANK
jgi:Domain of unknown function (DUF4129)